MNLNIQARQKGHAIETLGRTAAERVDTNFDRLAEDLRRIVTALKAYQIDLASDDITGILPFANLTLDEASPPDLTKFLREDRTFAVPPIDGGDASGIRTFFSTHISNAWTDMGCATSNYSGTNAANILASGQWQRWTTAAAANVQAGWRMTGTQFWADHNPDLIYRIRTDASIANIRIWLGAMNSIVAGNTDTAPARSVGVRFSTVAGDTSWVGFYVDSAGTQTVTSAIGSIAADTTYDVRINVTGDGTSIAFTINGASATLAATNLTGVGLTTVMLVGSDGTGAAKKLNFNRCHVETN